MMDCEGAESAAAGVARVGRLGLAEGGWVGPRFPPASADMQISIGKEAVRNAVTLTLLQRYNSTNSTRMHRGATP